MQFPARCDASSCLQSSSAGAKRAFLRGKGLSDEEIDEAVKRAAQQPTHSSAPSTDQAASAAASTGAPASPQPSEATAAPAGTVQNAGPGQQTLTVVPTQQSSWLQTTASVALLACAAYGVGSVVTPYAKRCWRYFRPSNGDDDVDMKTYVAQMFARYTQRQDEKLQEVADATSSAVHDLKVHCVPPAVPHMSVLQCVALRILCLAGGVVVLGGARQLSQCLQHGRGAVYLAMTCNHVEHT